MDAQDLCTDLGERFAKTPDEMAALRAEGLEAARDLCGFIDRSPTPYHAVREVVARLEAAAFLPLSEGDVWALAPGDRRYVVRGGSTLVAFVVGDESPASGGFRMLGAHTDSPHLKVKPNADGTVRGYQQLGVEVYGGPLFSTWLDRDLSLAGRVMVQGASGAPEARLVDLERAVARVPNLAIHLNRSVNADGLVLNAQRHLVPIVGLGQDAVLHRLLGGALGVEPGAILAYDLSLYDTARAALGGVEQELLYAARLDNLASCHAATTALVASAEPRKETRLIVLYDHEECGSRSALGAGGTILRDVLGRILDAHADAQPQGLVRAMSRSLLVSADMAHAVHPNYADLHEAAHAPQLNRGLVIKSNSNQSYATDGASAAAIALSCARAGFEAQRFVVRSDLPCGSTIGPITAAALGVSTVDVGAPMLSMHSCREMAGTLDVALTIRAFRAALTP